MSSAYTGVKPRLTFWQVWNMCFGFFGIQFGWSLQMGNMSAIYEFLGAKPDEIPGLWLAAPMTGLLVQPIIGYLSDRTWHPRLGRRRPYFLIGAILSSLALFIMPNSSAVWMAAGTLWILDSCINISMEPFRAFVADNLNEKQRSFGYAMQSMFIGAASFIALFLPRLLVDWFGISREKGTGGIPQNIMWSFYIGAAVFLVAVLYTVFRSKEQQAPGIYFQRFYLPLEICQHK
jgi:maltose/moltooligosaccharide transporter